MPTKKSKNLKIIKGTFRKCREKSGSPLCQTSSIPDPPNFLDEIALTEWKRIAPSLYESGLLSRFDVTAFSGYCQAYSRHIQAEIALKGQDLILKGASGAMVKNPLISVSRMASDQMLQLAKQFGLTPASRSKVVPKKAKKEDAWDKF